MVMQAIGTVKTIKDIYDDLKDWKKKNDFKNMFHEHAVKQIGYIGDKKSKSDTEVLLGTLFSDANKKTIENIALNTAPIKLIEVIFGFLEEEKESLCLNDASTNNTEFLNKHISIYIANIKEEIDKSYPEISNELYISEKFEDIIKIGKEILLAVNKQSKTDSSTRLNNDVKQETVSLAKVSEITEASMKKSFNGDACFEKTLYMNLNKNYQKVSISSVYQEPDCVYYDCGNNKLKNLLKAYNNIKFFNNEFYNYDKDEKSIILKVDKFYRNNNINVINVIKAFMKAEVFQDYNSKILFNEHDNVPTTCYIYGEAGIGKTTLTGKMCSDYLEITDKKIYFLKVRDLKIEDEKLLCDGKLLDFLCLNDNDLLWLDGLDEGEYNGSECITLSKIKQLIKNKDIRIIITSRPGYGTIDEDSIAIKISPFDKDKIKSYVESYFDKNTQIKEHGCDDIISIIKDDDKLYENYRILTIPLILYMFIYNTIMRSITKKGSIETGDQFSEMQLYDDLLGKNSYIFKNKVYDGDVELADEEKIRYYREEAKKIAFLMFKNNTLRTQIKLETEEISDMRVFDFYLSRYEGSGHKKYNVEFLHKSFYEYFIAEKLLDEVLKSAGEEQDFRKILNESLGVNRIDEYIFEFIEFMMGKSIGEELEKVKEKLQDNLITFTKEFCIGIDYYQNKGYFEDMFVQDIACNTFANFTGILLKIFYNIFFAINIFKFKEITNVELNLLYKNIRDLIKINNEFINLQGVDLSEVNLMSANLMNADLMKANLRDAELIRANLIEVNLIKAYLRGANLKKADLRGADLREASLSKANLAWVNLSGSNLSGVYLLGSNLRGADLRGADLRGARLIRAYLSRAKLCNYNLNGVISDEANLSNAVVQDADFRGCILSEKQRQYIKEHGGIVD